MLGLRFAVRKRAGERNSDLSGVSRRTRNTPGSFNEGKFTHSTFQQVAYNAGQTLPLRKIFVCTKTAQQLRDLVHISTHKGGRYNIDQAGSPFY